MLSKKLSKKLSQMLSQRNNPRRAVEITKKRRKVKKLKRLLPTLKNQTIKRRSEAVIYSISCWGLSVPHHCEVINKQSLTNVKYFFYNSDLKSDYFLIR